MGLDIVTLRTDTSASPDETVTITDFTLGQDRLVLTGISTFNPPAIVTGTPGSLRAALDLVATTASGDGTGANGTAAIVFAGDAYLVHNVATDTAFTVSVDGVIQLIGVTDLQVCMGWWWRGVWRRDLLPSDRLNEASERCSERASSLNL